MEGTKRFAFNRSGGPIHRIVRFQRSACGAMGFEYFTDAAPNMSALECWTTGWRPCARCFPEFNLAKWRELDARFPAETEEDGTAIWNAIWGEVYAERAKAVS